MSKNKHPIALPICFMTEFWERYGFYISQGLLTLILIKVIGLTEKQSFSVTGTYVGLVYTTSIIGGLIADKFLGHFRSTILGEVALVSGFAILGYGISAESFHMMATALAFISVGTGLVKSNVSSFLGNFYDSHDPRRDLGFSIFYVGINLGSLIGGILAGYLSSYLGWSIPFYTAAIGAFVGLLTIYFGVKAASIDYEKKEDNIAFGNYLWGVGITVLSIIFCVYVILSPSISDLVFIIISVLSVFLLFFTAYKHPSYLKNCLAYLVLLIISVVFWAIFFQMFSSMVIFIEKMVNHNIFGFTLPTASFFTLESVGVILLGSLVGKMWVVLAEKGMPIHDSTKFAIGMVIMTFAFCFFAFIVTIHNPAALISGYVIVVSYFLISIGELALSPIGLSVANKLAPTDSRGLFMGIWMISLGIGGKLSGVLAGLTAIPKGDTNQSELFHIYSHALWEFAGISAAALLLALISIPFLKKLVK
ncbi:peptide MFS transporter [Francisellaceae bacterium]|nr:peptide MFS transporter [Francisellaceae bacterium]